MHITHCTINDHAVVLMQDFKYDEKIDQLFIKNNIPMYVRNIIENELEVDFTKQFAKYISIQDLLSLQIESKDLENLMRLHQFTILYIGDWSW